ncbi:MAG TPA: TMEM175 family protein [Candidatus Eremiobacteraceae bacterium]
MRATYNLIAGQSLERLAALSDGVFAIAMTLLVLDLRVPLSSGISTEHDLWRALAPLAPQLVAYLMTFVTLGIFWVGQQTQVSRFIRCDRDLAWIHIGFLLAVSMTPFSTGLLAEFITFRIALIVYWANILLLGVALFGSWRYATRTGLVKEDTTQEIGRAVERRIVVAQALYALGALLCIVNTYWSIAVIVLVQLNYVFAPRFRLLYRL